MADDIFVSNDIQLDVDFGEIFVIDQGIVTKVVAKKYDPTKTYVVGEYVIYQEKLYKCNTAIEEPEEFDAEKWTQVLLADEVQIANANIALKANVRDVYAKSETYNKTEVNTALASKADANTTYSKTEVDTALASKADTATTYTKTEVDTALGDKADKSDTYTKTEVDTALSAKANSDDVYAKTDTYSKGEIDTDIYKKTETYNKNEVDGIINNLPAPMIFKGTLGVNGTITDLPTASADNEGFTYKVITDGTYASQTAKVGDIFTSNGTAWVHIPSGDETFTDTWRSIKVNGTEKLSGSITSGSVDFKNGTNSTAVFDPSDNSIKVNVDGYTQAQIDTKLSAKANQADVTTALNNKADKSTTYTKTEVNTALELKADKSTTYTKAEVDNLVNLISTVSGDICTFETTLPEPYPSVTVNVLATGGNGTPDNPIPINGYTEANITRCGVNFFDKSTVTNGYLINGAGNYVSYPDTNVSDYTPVVEGVGFYLYGLTKHPNTNQDNFELFDGSKTKVGYANVKTWEYPYVIPSGVKYVRYTVHDDDLNTAQFSPTNNAPYAPYNGHTYTIAFGQTVYGGVLDVTRGKLTITHTSFDMGDVYWAREEDSQSPGIYYFRYLTNPLAKQGSICICSCYETYTGSGVIPDLKLKVSGAGQYIFIRARDDNYTSEVAFRTAVTGQRVVYELTTPFEVDLTPVQIRALVGENNVFADCGETTVEFINSNAEDTVDIAKNVIEQTNLSDLADIPNPPTTDGNYRLKVTILDGKATYSWEEIT